MSKNVDTFNRKHRIAMNEVTKLTGHEIYDRDQLNHLTTVMLCLVI